MDAVELRRYELRSVMLREQERKELNQVKRFNSLIRTSESEIKIKGEKIKGLREEIPGARLMGDPAEQISRVRKNLNDIKVLLAERKVNEKNLQDLLQSRDSVIETITKIKAQNSKVSELSDAKKEEIKSRKESVSLEESTEIRGAQQRVENNGTSPVSSPGAELSITDNPVKFSESQLVQSLPINGQLPQFSGQRQDPSSSAMQQYFSEQSGARSWEEIRSGIKSVESTQTESGASVKLNINSESGSEMKVEIEKRGNKNVKVRIQSGSEIDQRKIWLKKAEIVSALEKAGYSVEALHMGGAK